MTDATTRIDEIVRQHDVVLFMKGTELFPQCGFSSRAVAIARSRVPIVMPANHRATISARR